MFSRGVTYAEHALFWSEERGTAALAPLYALIDAGVRLEVEFHLMREALVGTWHLPSGGRTRIEFDADGLFRYGPLTGGSEGDVIDSGTYLFEGELVTIVRDDATQTCVPGDVSVLRVRFAASDSVALTVVEDTCGRWGGPYTLDRVVD